MVFGVSNIKNMRQFYESWNVVVNRQPTAVDLQLAENKMISFTLALLNINRQPTAGDLDWQEFFSLGFTQHMEMLSKTKTLEERVFYIHKAATLHWNKFGLFFVTLRPCNVCMMNNLRYIHRQMTPTANRQSNIRTPSQCCIRFGRLSRHCVWGFSLVNI